MKIYKVTFANKESEDKWCPTKTHAKLLANGKDGTITEHELALRGPGKGIKLSDVTAFLNKLSD